MEAAGGKSLSGGKNIAQRLCKVISENSSTSIVKNSDHHYICFISQLWLTSHPRSTVVLLDTGTPGADDGSEFATPQL